MALTRDHLISFLQNNHLDFKSVMHPAVFTMEASAAITIDLEGQRCKNLLLETKGGKRVFLVVTTDNKAVDLAGLKMALGSSRLSFCAPDQLQTLLGVTSGALSPLALINDTNNAVHLVIDTALLDASHFLFHPLDNRESVSMTSATLNAFLLRIGYTPTWIDIPARQPN